MWKISWKYLIGHPKLQKHGFFSERYSKLVSDPDTKRISDTVKVEPVPALDEYLLWIRVEQAHDPEIIENLGPSHV